MRKSVAFWVGWTNNQDVEWGSFRDESQVFFIIESVFRDSCIFAYLIVQKVWILNLVGVLKLEILKLFIGFFFLLFEPFKFFWYSQLLCCVFDLLLPVVVVEIFQLQIVILNNLAVFLLHEVYEWILNQFLPFFEDLLLSLLVTEWFREADLVGLDLPRFDSLADVAVHEFACDQLILAPKVVVVD